VLYTTFKLKHHIVLKIVDSLGALGSISTKYTFLHANYSFDKVDVQLYFNVYQKCIVTCMTNEMKLPVLELDILPLY